MGRGEYYRNKYGGGGRGFRGGGGGGGARGGRFGGGGRDEGFQRYGGSSARNRSRSPRGSFEDNKAPCSWQQLGELLAYRLHNKSYPCYHDLERNVFQFEDPTLSFALAFDHIQGDPFASPSRAHVVVEPKSAALDPQMYCNRIRTIALCDFLTRQFALEAKNAGADAKAVSNSWHGAKGGDLSIDAPGQHVLERTSVLLSPNGAVEARFNINLPARGRTICGDWAKTILVDTLPVLVKKALVLKSLDVTKLWQHLHCVEDQEALRKLLKPNGLVGFICDGAILPRASGACDRAMARDQAIPFQSPPSMRRTLELPNRGTITGMGIPEGITLLVGGGFHGKSTVLKALEVGVYNHVPEDGREFVVTDANAVKIRSEDSRSVSCCDISAFISNLPFQQDTSQFSTQDASGSTSQAANIMEALEVGASTLLIDEDTCATNFMIRDWQMQQLVAKNKEPITPFISKVRALFSSHGVSSILVIGGAGDYFSVADQVIMMDCYSPRDVTQEAKEIAQQTHQQHVQQETSFGAIHPRIPLANGFETHGKVVARGSDRIQFGEIDLDLSAVEQIVETSQVRAIADAILYLRNRFDGRHSLKEVLDLLEKEMDESNSLDTISVHRKSGFYARPRRFEIAAAVNRLRSASMKQ